MIPQLSSISSPPRQGKNARCIQSHLITPMSLGSQRALTLHQTHSHELCLEVASWHHHANMKICNEKLVKDANANAKHGHFFDLDNGMASL